MRWLVLTCFHFIAWNWGKTKNWHRKLIGETISRVREGNEKPVWRKIFKWNINHSIHLILIWSCESNFKNAVHVRQRNEWMHWMLRSEFNSSLISVAFICLHQSIISSSLVKLFIEIIWFVRRHLAYYINNLIISSYNNNQLLNTPYIYYRMYKLRLARRQLNGHYYVNMLIYYSILITSILLVLEHYLQTQLTYRFMFTNSKMVTRKAEKKTTKNIRIVYILRV